MQRCTSLLKTFLYSTLLLQIFLALPANAQEHNNLNDGVGLHGFDPVSYFKDGPVEGSEKIRTEHEGVIWYFSSAANRETFLLAPEDYLPEYGGFCAYAMLEGDKVDIDPESYKIVNGKLYVFYDGFFGDTLKKWNRMLRDTPESELITTADQEWNSILSGE